MKNLYRVTNLTAVIQNLGNTSLQPRASTEVAFLTDSISAGVTAGSLKVDNLAAYTSLDSISEVLGNTRVGLAAATDNKYYAPVIYTIKTFIDDGVDLTESLIFDAGDDGVVQLFADGVLVAEEDVTFTINAEFAGGDAAFDGATGLFNVGETDGAYLITAIVNTKFVATVSITVNPV